MKHYFQLLLMIYFHMSKHFISYKALYKLLLFLCCSNNIIRVKSIILMQEICINSRILYQTIDYFGLHRAF